MPTQSTTYNTRVTDEGLEKRFRDTFRSQSGAELVDDLYASGVIIPVVDFTSAAEGSALRQDLQTAWDFSTANYRVSNGTQVVANTPGFWQFNLNAVLPFNLGSLTRATVQINDGTSTKIIWDWEEAVASPSEIFTINSGNLICFLRSGDSLESVMPVDCQMQIWVRQIADVSGNLTNPLGFTSS